MPPLLRAGARAAGFLLVLAAPASAADWSIRSFFSQRFETNTNRGLDSDDSFADPEFEAITDLGASISAQTPRGRVVIAPGVRGLFSTEEGFDSNNVAPRFNGSLAFAAPRSRTTASLNVSPRFVNDRTLDSDFLDGEDDFDDLDRLDDLPELEEEVLQIAVRGRARYAYEASPVDTISIGASFRLREYLDDSGALDPTRSFGIDGDWDRALTPATTFTLSPSFRQFFTEGEDRSDGRTVALRAGGAHRVNERLALNGSLGPSYTWRSDGGSGDLGLVGNLGAAYSLGETRYAASIAQTVDQDSEGEIESQVSARASVVHALDPLSNLSLSARLGFENPLFGSGESEDEDVIFTLSPSYSRALTRDWRVGLGYRFIAENDEEGFRSGNSVFVQLSRNFSVLP